MTVSAIVVSILSASGGFIVGALSRQGEINRLQKQVESLQKELAKSQKLQNEFHKDIQLLRIQIQLKDNEDLIDVIKNQQDHSTGEVLFAYGMYEYLELKLKHIIDNDELTEKEAMFIDAFSKILDNSIPEGVEGTALKKTVKRYLIDCFKERTDKNETPDFYVLISRINAVLVGEKNNKDDPLIPDLECLSMDEEQMRLMYSLERFKILYDINSTNDSKKQSLKKEWYKTWARQLLKSLEL